MVAYRLLFPETSRVHSVFDGRLLEEVKNYCVEQELPQDLEGDNTKSQETKRVLATHTVKKGEDKVSQMLIQSKGGGMQYSKSTPSFPIGGQVSCSRRWK